MGNKNSSWSPGYVADATAYAVKQLAGQAPNVWQAVAELASPEQKEKAQVESPAMMPKGVPNTMPVKKVPYLPGAKKFKFGAP